MKKQWKVMGYNLHAGVDRDWKTTTLHLAMDVIRGYAPDLLGAEEVLTNNNMAPDWVMHEDMAKALGMNAVFGRALIRDEAVRREYGVAAFARCPMELAGKVSLPVPEGSEPRVFTAVRILAEKPFYFIVTHFSYEGEYEKSDEYRERAARLVTETVRKNHWYPAILTGDLNSPQDSAVLKIFHEDWDVCNDRDPVTPSASVDGTIQIDYICTYPKGAFRLVDFGFINDLEASDHKPVTATLELAD